jgi:hypothetical protein
VWQVVYNKKLWLENKPNDFSTRYKLLTADGSNPYTTDTYGGSKENVPYPGTSNVTELQLFGHKIEGISEDTGGTRFKFLAGKTHTATSETTAEQMPEKMLENGRIVIRRGGKIFDITGREIK